MQSSLFMLEQLARAKRNDFLREARARRVLEVHVSQAKYSLLRQLYFALFR